MIYYTIRNGNNPGTLNSFSAKSSLSDLMEELSIFMLLQGSISEHTWDQLVITYP